MAQDYLANDFDGNPRSRRIRGGMPHQIMWPQFDPGQLPGALDNDPCCSISDWENLALRRYCLVFQIRPQTVRNFSGNEHDLSVPSAFGASYHQFLVADIIMFRFRRNWNFPSFKLGVSCRTSPVHMPPLAINSRMSRFLTFVVLKMVSSTVSFSTTSQCVGLPGR